MNTAHQLPAKPSKLYHFSPVPPSKFRGLAVDPAFAWGKIRRGWFFRREMFEWAFNHLCNYKRVQCLHLYEVVSTRGITFTRFRSCILTSREIVPVKYIGKFTVRIVRIK